MDSRRRSLEYWGERVSAFFANDEHSMERKSRSYFSEAWGFSLRHEYVDRQIRLAESPRSISAPNKMRKKTTALFSTPSVFNPKRFHPIHPPIPTCHSPPLSPIPASPSPRSKKQEGGGRGERGDEGVKRGTRCLLTHTHLSCN